MAKKKAAVEIEPQEAQIEAAESEGLAVVDTTGNQDPEPIAKPATGQALADHFSAELVSEQDGIATIRIGECSASVSLANGLDAAIKGVKQLGTLS